ncbi:solute carrier family 22 member 20-like [Monodelphis domestica]|uniref:solute carrier family 22 member 20-like n=1 Tax=Monodelphis domestica TaxID=13616 RepID=UPI0024E1FFC5|nr:solute carrier family 22 member 20-like [Monodelphis domestica]
MRSGGDYSLYLKWRINKAEQRSQSHFSEPEGAKGNFKRISSPLLLVQSMEPSLEAEQKKEGDVQSASSKDWDLVCGQKPLKSIVQTIYMGGQQAGSIVFGILSDRYGRRTMLLCSSLMATIVGSCASFMPTYAGYVVFLFLNGVALTGVTITCLCLSEYQRKSESWLLYYGAEAGTAELLAAWRGKELASFGKVVMSYIEEDLAGVKASPFFTDLVRTPGIRITTFCLMLEWFACGFSFYGLGLDLQKFGFSIYWVQLIFALIDLPGKLLSSISMSYLGRRVTLISFMLLPGVLIIISIFVPQDMPVFWMILSVLGKGFLGGAISCLYLYIEELYPTEIRQMGLSAGLFSIRFGAFLSPMVFIGGSYFPILQPLLFGMVPIVSAASACFLTETRGLPLLDTIQEAENRSPHHESQQAGGGDYEEVAVALGVTLLTSKGPPGEPNGLLSLQ